MFVWKIEIDHLIRVPPWSIYLPSTQRVWNLTPGKNIPLWPSILSRFCFKSWIADLSFISSPNHVWAERWICFCNFCAHWQPLEQQSSSYCQNRAKSGLRLFCELTTANERPTSKGSWILHLLNWLGTQVSSWAISSFSRALLGWFAIHLTRTRGFWPRFIWDSSKWIERDSDLEPKVGLTEERETYLRTIKCGQSSWFINSINTTRWINGSTRPKEHFATHHTALFPIPYWCSTWDSHKCVLALHFLDVCVGLCPLWTGHIEPEKGLLKIDFPMDNKQISSLLPRKRAEIGNEINLVRLLFVIVDEWR